MATRIPAQVFPPGDFIREELEERGWSQADLAKIMHRDRPTISKLLAGKVVITPTTARDLAEAFDTSPEYWMNLETAYQLRGSRPTGGEVRRRARLFEHAPVRDMERRGWIRDCRTVEDLTAELRRFYGCQSLDSPPQVPVAARASGPQHERLSAAQVAWCHQVVRIARLVKAGPFSVSRLRKGLGKIRELAAYPEEARHVPRVLAAMGVRFVVVEHLPRTKIDGATLWPDRGTPIIALSLRYDRIDCFWHTLCHELAHVLHEHACSVDDNLVGDGSSGTESRPEIEQIADREASEMLIAARELDSFINRVRPYFSKSRVNQFANIRQIHPGIVIGQLQFRKAIKYSHSRELLVKVRDIVTAEALTDGWGRVTTVD
jgi:HTH-type transcriptional regulator/antitoxin HigA